MNRDLGKFDTRLGVLIDFRLLRSCISLSPRHKALPRLMQHSNQKTACTTTSWSSTGYPRVISGSMLFATTLKTQYNKYRRSWLEEYKIPFKTLIRPARRAWN